uniref:DNA repair endonuclease XPF-like n=1 Tax=Styela clava TaxID=7725 RepID=UPI00193A850D|nr:DNA repair endonuclease XPF-like [Styela clava]
MILLEYENQIFLDLFEESALLILCEGLGIDRIFLSLLRLYSDLKELVLVLNTDEFQQEYYTQRLKNLGIKKLPIVISSDISVQERQKLYLQGGIYFMSSRILVMDLLVERIPIHLITGILIAKAHKLIEACQESFILRLYREKNKTGFIKGLTDSPTSFLGEYAKLEKAMKNMFVGKVMLWPRFHASILSCLKKHEPEVVEIGIAMTESMTAIQNCLLEIISACLQEIKSYNPGLDTSELTLEKSLGSNFDKRVRAQLDPIWNQIGSKTKSMVNDLRMLRSLLRGLTQYDCVTFLKMVENLTANEKNLGKNTGWLFLDATDKLFIHSRRRVYGNKTKKDTAIKDSEPLLEESPKWAILSDVLNDIKEANEKTDANLGPGSVLICASDFRTVDVLQTYMQLGSRQTMVQSYEKLFGKSLSNLGDITSPSLVKSGVLSAPVIGQSTEEEFQSLILCSENPKTYLHALHGNADFYSLSKALETVSPRFVVLYNSSINFIRQLEVYKACKPGVPFRIYVFTYESSTEEQVYLTTVRREKEAFNSLIQQKSTMVIPKEIEGKVDHAPRLSRDPKPAYENTGGSRRIGGQTEDSVEHRVVIDMREFRSELPSLLYKRGVNIDPVTIEVGDYIITPEICVERKSLTDLIGSLQSGRLYNQCVSMCRHYSKPMLMIEFDATKAFSFKARGIMANTTLKELNQKLVLLIIHFPKLRFSWCPSPAIAAEFFHEIKIGRAQPSAIDASAVASKEESGAAKSDIYNSGPYDFLLKIPGIDIINCRRVLNHVKNLLELSTLTEEQLASILDSKSNAQQLYEFFHKDYNPDKLQLAKIGSKGGRSKRPNSAMTKPQTGKKQTLLTKTQRK